MGGCLGFVCITSSHGDGDGDGDGDIRSVNSKHTWRRRRIEWEWERKEEGHIPDLRVPSQYEVLVTEASPTQRPRTILRAYVRPPLVASTI